MADLQLLLGHSQPHAFQKPYANFGRTVLDDLTTELSGLNQYKGLLSRTGCAGDMRREDTIPANPTMHSMPSSLETLDPAFLSQLQALRIKAIAASYLTPNTLSGLRADDFCSQYQNKTVPAWPIQHHVNINSTSSKASIRSNSKKASQKVLADKVKRTIYICDIHQQVTEERLASCFQKCGQVVDCRICGDPNSAMRFAFIEFLDEAAVHNALARNGILLGSYPLRVLPSKTAIVPVNNQYLPKTSVERELCGRTVYAANIDKKVDRTDVQAFFESLCGPVSKLRLLGDYHHPTRIAFVEFTHADSARAALNCSGALLGSIPVRVSPSKTPVRPDPRHDDSPVSPLFNFHK